MSTLSYDEVHFLAALSDGKAEGWMGYLTKTGRIPTPMSQLSVQNMADQLRKRGLIKDTFSGYKITPAGLEAVKDAALQMFRDMSGSSDGDFWMSREKALEMLRESLRL